MRKQGWLFPNAERTAYTKLLTVYSAAVVIAVVAWVLNVGQLYWMAGALALLPQASRLVAGLEQRGVRVRRELPYSGHQGEYVAVQLHAENLTPIPKLHLSVMDSLPSGLEAAPAEALPLSLGPRGRDTVEYRLRLGRRGLHELEAVRVQSTDPLGLAHEESVHTLPASILVYPRVAALPPQTFPPQMGGGSAPVENAHRQGEGTSFFGIREYRRGDPLRHVHWRTAARTGQLAVIEWEAEESRDTVLALETAAAADRKLGLGTTLDLAAGLAASLASALLAEEHSVRLLAPGTTQWEPVGRRGTSAMGPILESLARMAPTDRTSVAAELKLAVGSVPTGATFCWITPALNNELEAGCRFLIAAGLRPVVYALIPAPRAASAAASAVLDRLMGLGIHVVPLYSDDEVTLQLLG